ncbi:hypothetical protein HF072_08345 [Bacillus sp. RO3]|nr:hypothetical protein [Bacillus sp. RO3]
MINVIGKLITSFILGYLFIKWFPGEKLLNSPEFIVELVLNPVPFFASMMSLMVGLMVQGNLLKFEFDVILKLSRGKLHKGLVVIPFHIVIIYLLSCLGMWQTMIFSFLSFFYGIISIDFRRQGGHNA